MPNVPDVPATGQAPAPQQQATATTPPSPSPWVKVARVFLFSFIGTFLTTLLPIADKIANGEHVDFTLVKALAVSAIAAAIAAAVRAVVALLPAFADDNGVGLTKN
jgi:hypothetical protein